MADKIYHNDYNKWNVNKGTWFEEIFCNRNLKDFLPVDFVKLSTYSLLKEHITQIVGDFVQSSMQYIV